MHSEFKGRHTLSSRRLILQPLSLSHNGFKPCVLVKLWYSQHSLDHCQQCTVTCSTSAAHPWLSGSAKCTLNGTSEAATLPSSFIFFIFFLSFGINQAPIQPVDGNKIAPWFFGALKPISRKIFFFFFQFLSFLSTLVKMNELIFYT